MSLHERKGWLLGELGDRLDILQMTSFGSVIDGAVWTLCEADVFISPQQEGSLIGFPI